MHASIEHLLSIRDGEAVAAAIAGHVEQCSICSAELHRLSMARARLHALAQIDAPPSSWERIRSRAARPARMRRPWPGMMAAAAAAIVALSIIVGIAVRDAPSPAIEAGRPGYGGSRNEAASTPAVDELVAQSQQLEQLLHALPERPHVERVSTAATIDTLEQRIQWLDFQLSDASDRGLGEQQARRLWSERVELMDSLVKVRYAEARRASF